jgi:hypothetical protein
MDDGSGFGIAREIGLKLAVGVIVEVFRDEAREHGRFDELHSTNHTQIA